MSEYGGRIERGVGRVESGEGRREEWGVGKSEEDVGKMHVVVMGCRGGKGVHNRLSKQTNLDYSNPALNCSKPPFNCSNLPNKISRTISNLSKASSRKRKVHDSALRNTDSFQSAGEWGDTPSLHWKMQRRVRINVSGQIFEINASLLDMHPETLFGDPGKWNNFFDHDRKELFFDRHRPSFESIFFYFQYGGFIRRPYHVPNDIFLEELLFYQLEADIIEEYKRAEGYSIEEVKTPSNPTMKYVWDLFEHPNTSIQAFLIGLLSVFMTVLSIVLFCVETLPVYSKSHCVSDVAPNFLDPFFMIETSCTIWFTIELFARFVSCPNKFEFGKDIKVSVLKIKIF